MNNALLHLVIVWSKASAHKDYIIKDLNSNFDIVKIFKVHWSNRYFIHNLCMFYSHSLKDKSNKRMMSIIKSKKKNVGTGDFYAIIFKDTNPLFEKRPTTSGERIVNVNVFDRKTAYRKIAGGSRVHSSDDSWETNKDLTLLFGLNSKDFCNKYKKGNLEEEQYNKNCTGILGYVSLEQFFYVLNNSIKYVVLRNHESFPSEYTVNEHGDIDLLTESIQYIERLTGAKRVYKKKYRVQNTVIIDGSTYPFDFRYVGDNYYDTAWENSILDSRILSKGLFYCPNEENQFYTLLYHAYVQKKQVKDDYHSKLSYYANLINTNYIPNDIESIMSNLYSYMNEQEYDFTIPVDKSVYYNNKNVKLARGRNYLANELLIENVHLLTKDYTQSEYLHFVGNSKGVKLFIKYGGSGNICENEYYYSKRAYDSNPINFVKPIKYGENGSDEYIIFEYNNCVTIQDYLKEHNNFSKELICNQIVDIYKTLKKNQIIHRDIRPDNFVVVDGVIKLLDFQFSVDNIKRKELDFVKKNPTILMALGGKFRYSRIAWSDYHSLIKVTKYLKLTIKKKDLKKDKPMFVTSHCLINRKFYYWFFRKLYHKFLTN